MALPQIDSVHIYLIYAQIGYFTDVFRHEKANEIRLDNNAEEKLYLRP